MNLTKSLLNIAFVSVCIACVEPFPRQQEFIADSGAADTSERMGPNPVRIIVLGDRTGHPDDDSFEQVLEQAAKLRPDMLVSVGDLIQGYQPDDKIESAKEEWDDVLGRMDWILGEIPVFSTAGNHDVWSPLSEELFEAQLGHPLNYGVDIGSVRIILFDTSRVSAESELDEAALDWLWRELYKAREKKARVVITHKPLWAKDPGGRYGSPLHDVLIAGGADWVIAGHWHHTMADDRDGVRYRLLGPSGAKPNRKAHPESGNFDQFGLLVVDDRGMEFSIVREGGIVESDVVPYELNQLEWKIQNLAVTLDGFELDSVYPRQRGVIELKIKNVTEQPLKEPLCIGNKDDGWQVAFPCRVIGLKPDEETRVRVQYSRLRNTALFPGPQLRLPFSWPAGGQYVLDKNLTPTLFRRLRRSGFAPIIDGRLDDTVWKRASYLGPLRAQHRGKMPETRAKILLVDETLYLGLEMREPDMQGQSHEIRERDGFMEDEDHIVILLDVDQEQDGYARISINAAGAQSDQLVGSGKNQAEDYLWTGPQTVAVSRAEDSWFIELGVPLKELGFHKGTGKIGLNLYRVRVRGDYRWQAGWQPLLENNRDSFGFLSIF